MANPPHLLVVEDDPLHIKSFRYAAETYDLRCPVSTVQNGVEALERLRSGATTASNTVVLTDLEMPRMGGLGLLRELRADPALRTTVVFVVSSTDDRDSVREAYELGIAGFVRKSSLTPDRRHLIQLLRDFTHLVTLPTP